jgi:hypothetical protein
MDFISIREELQAMRAEMAEHYQDTIMRMAGDALPATPSGDLAYLLSQVEQQLTYPSLCSSPAPKARTSRVRRLFSSLTRRF